MDEKNTVPLPSATTLVYGEHPSQFIDVYTPDGVGPHPVVVLIHGGFWRLPWGRDLMLGLAGDLVGRGFAAVNVEYRRLGEDGGGWPGTCEDIVSALGAMVGGREQTGRVGMESGMVGGGVGVVDSASPSGSAPGSASGSDSTAGSAPDLGPGSAPDLGSVPASDSAPDSGLGSVPGLGSGTDSAPALDSGSDSDLNLGLNLGLGPSPELDSGSGLASDLALDLTRVAVVGHSAGGYLALWAAKHTPVPLRVVVSQAGVLDLRSAARDRLDGDSDGRLSAAVEFVGGEPHDADFDAAYSLASPIELLPLGPAVHQFVLHGDVDNRVPFQQSVDYVAAARRVGDSVEFAAFTGMGHFEVIDAAHESWLRVVEELTRRLGA